MSARAASAAPHPLVTQIFADAGAPRLWSLLGWGVALGAHALAAGIALGEQRAPSPAAPALTVELAAPEPPPPPPPAETPPTPPEPPAPERAPTVKAAAAPPEPARAGALLTAKADPEPSPAADEPVDFTNDPSVLGFGSGVVAVGGKALVGAAHARPSAVAPSTGLGGVAPRPSGEALTPAFIKLNEEMREALTWLQEHPRVTQGLGIGATAGGIAAGVRTEPGVAPGTPKLSVQYDRPTMSAVLPSTLT